MIRLFLVFCILLVCYDISGQGVAVKKSGDVVVIRGKSYYLHTVEAGQTLYSICKAYGVDVDAVKELNDKKDNALSLHEVLKIPYTEPFVQQDDKYYYHKLEKGETLYAVSRKFDIKVKRILKSNPEYENEVSLPVGAVVRLPLNEISMAAVRAEKIGQDKVAAAVVQVKATASSTVKEDKKAKDKKTEYVKVENIAVKQEAVRQEIEEPVKENISEKHENKAIETEKNDVPEYLTEVVMTDEPYVKVALLLPLNARDYSFVSDTLNVRDHKSISARSEQFLYFYEGILLAVDSLKNKGYNIDLRVFDTERDAEKMYSITSELNHIKPDMIIGPVYASAFKVMADNLENKNTPMIYPLSSRNEDFGKYPNFVQVNATFATVAEEMADWVTSRGDANIINVVLPGSKGSEEQALAGRIERQFYANDGAHRGGHFYKWDSEHEPVTALKPILSPDRENIIVLPTTKEADVSKILPALSVYADHYKITVIGFPEWQTFTSVEHEIYFKLNVRFFAYSYVDISTVQSRAFAEEFRNYFRAEPNSLGYKAYDMGLYFIGLAAKYRDRTLDAIEYYGADGDFSRFNFSKIPGQQGKENRGLYIVNFGSDYQLKIHKVK